MLALWGDFFTFTSIQGLYYSKDRLLPKWTPEICTSCSIYLRKEDLMENSREQQTFIVLFYWKNWKPELKGTFNSNMITMLNWHIYHRCVIWLIWHENNMYHRVFDSFMFYQCYTSLWKLNAWLMEANTAWTCTIGVKRRGIY